MVIFSGFVIGRFFIFQKDFIETDILSVRLLRADFLFVSKEGGF
jgi:hypothetical protein